MIHEIDSGQFVISSGEVWLPGCYESRRAANYAFRFPNKVLGDLRDAADIITFKMLQETARADETPSSPKS